MENSPSGSWFNISAAIVILIALAIIFAIFFGFFAVFFKVQNWYYENSISPQAKCATRAESVFESIQGETGNISYTYKSHYGSNINKCYILIHGTGAGGSGTSDKLLDAYNKTVLADCKFYSADSELNYCSYNGSSGIYNMDNFNSFIEPYMTAK